MCEGGAEKPVGHMEGGGGGGEEERETREDVACNIGAVVWPLNEGFQEKMHGRRRDNLNRGN